MKKIFDTDKRIRLGIWGLGRGKNFIDAARLLNIDVVAGCDVHPEIRARFQHEAPEAYCTADEKEFLAYDMDAVLIATFLPDHAKHTLQALEAGKHVICEVTPFQTPADAVKIIEAVEKSKKIYILLENYPFMPVNMYMQERYAEGFFGDFVYGEFEYVHEIRALYYGYNTDPDALPVEPGYSVHNWRSIINMQHYCTHSLGPAMYITGLRPESVSSLKNPVNIPGALADITPATASPSLIRMSNGGLVRNLMGATTNDSVGMRFWGTRAAAHNLLDEFKIRVGGTGYGYMLDIKPELSELWQMALNSAHGGGDFWELYFFAREFFYGEKAFWDVYRAADVTLAGIMALRSEKLNGASVRIPDFRNPEERDAYRNDNESGAIEFDTSDVFPEGHDKTLTGNFAQVMVDLYPKNMGGLNLFNNVYDGMKLYKDISNAEHKIKIRNALNRLIKELPALSETCKLAVKIMDAYPESVPGRTIARVLAAQDMERLLNPEKTIAELRAWAGELTSIS